MNEPKSNDATAAFDEQLVAYLDGELDVTASREIEARLASDPKARQRLQSLEHTWDLLDELDATPVGEPFTQSTLEMVAVAAREGVDREQADAPQRSRRLRRFFFVGVLAAAAIGFGAVMLAVPNQNRQLLEDLPILENFDEYRQAESVAFLKNLQKRKLFTSDDGEKKTVAAVPVPDDSAGRRRYVENLALEDRQQLLKVDNRFLAMEPDDQRLLRQLQSELHRDADAKHLREIMHRYYEWVRTLPSSTRADLLEMKPEDRAAAVAKRMQYESRFSREDVETLSKWFQNRMREASKLFADRLSPADRKRLENPKLPETERARLLFQAWRHSPRPPEMLTEDDLRTLRSQLSPNARAYLESLPVDAQQRELMMALWQRHRPGDRGGPKTDDQRLMNFFERLSDQDRDRLMGMTPDAMHRELQRMYNESLRRPNEGLRPRPRDFEGEH